MVLSVLAQFFNLLLVQRYILLIKNLKYGQDGSKGKWNEWKGRLKQKYGELTDDDLRPVRPKMIW